MKNEDVLIGCCGFCMSQQEYFKKFRLIEIQRSFYQLPQIETAERWRESAPDYFTFTMKAWQGITHTASSPTYRKIKLDFTQEQRKRLGFFQPTDEVFHAWEKTARFARTLDAKVVLLQTPPKFIQTDSHLKNLHYFFEHIPKPNFHIALEFRASWDETIIYDLCAKFSLLHCVDPFAGNCVSESKIQYFRLHGSPPGEKMYHYQYTERDFEFLSKKLNALQKKSKRIFCLFNNVAMKDDALKFSQLLESRKQNNFS